MIGELLIAQQSWQVALLVYHVRINLFCELPYTRYAFLRELPENYAGLPNLSVVF